MKLKDVLSKTVTINVSALKNALSQSLTNENHYDVDTRAWCILHYTGMDKFIKEVGEFAPVKEKLAQYLANDDKDGAKEFLEAVVDAVADEIKRKVSATTA